LTHHEAKLIRRVRAWTSVFIAALILSGATAIPLEAELDWFARWSGAEEAVPEQTVSAAAGTQAPWWAEWLIRVRDALHDANAKYPFLAYGTDWLAFGHFVIALAFVGLWRDPVRNRWLIDFGLIACGLVIPYAFLMGGIRGIPVGWRLVDCSFGVFGAVPLWYCRGLVNELEQSHGG